MGQSERMVEVTLGRIVIHDGADRQYIYLCEREGERGFPIVIGSGEAGEIQRVVTGVETVRPLTHQLCHDAIRALGGELSHVDIVDLRDNTFFAQMVLDSHEDGGTPTVVDARPSDAIALALRAECRIRVAESVIARAAADEAE